MQSSFVQDTLWPTVPQRRPNGPRDLSFHVSPPSAVAHKELQGVQGCSGWTRSPTKASLDSTATIASPLKQSTEKETSEISPPCRSKPEQTPSARPFSF